MSAADKIRGPLTLLLSVFLTLKLTGAVDWSWWLVLAPLWAPLAIGLGQAITGVMVISLGVAIGRTRSVVRIRNRKGTK